MTTALRTTCARVHVPLQGVVCGAAGRRSNRVGLGTFKSASLQVTKCLLFQTLPSKTALPHHDVPKCGVRSAFKTATYVPVAMHIKSVFLTSGEFSPGVISSCIMITREASTRCRPFLGKKASASGRQLFCSTSSSFSSLIDNMVPCGRVSKVSCLNYLPRGYGCKFSNLVGLQRVTASADFELRKKAATPAEKLKVNTLSKSSAVSANLVHPPSPTTDSKIIHSTAVVHPDAIIGEPPVFRRFFRDIYVPSTRSDVPQDMNWGVEIGAFCTVGQKVKLGNGCTLHPGSHVFGDSQLGENCVLFTGAVVGADIPGRTVIGDNNLIGYHAVVGVKCQDMKYKEGDECNLYIGNNNDIREFASVHRSSKPDDDTIVGNDNLIMGSCHIAHDCKVGNRNILANGTLIGGHVVLEDLVHTGGAVAVHQFCHIGSYSFLAGGSMVDRDVPMFMMVAGDRAELRGLNLEGMRRCGFSDLEVRSIRKAYQKLFMSSDAGVGLEERLSELEQSDSFSAVPAVGLMLQSVRHCFGENRRGICRFRHWSSV